jgi:DNA-binding HxlR family transcriptional regulator
MDLIGGKWKVIVLWHLKNKILRFSQLKRRLPGITQKMLTQQLRELELDGLVIRKIYPQVPPKVEYCLSDYGKSFLPILNLMYDWGIKYSNDFQINLSFIQTYKDTIPTPSIKTRTVK